MFSKALSKFSLAGVLCVVPALAQELAGPLATFSVEDRRKKTAPATTMRLEISTQEQAKLFAQLKAGSGARQLRQSGNIIALELRENQTFQKMLSPKSFVAPTFLVDYDLPIFKTLLKELSAGAWKKASPDDLANFAYAFIASKSSRRPFDLASKVVETREGDCSEHAVLLAALHRLHKLPSRIITGVAFLVAPGTGKVAAIGHAWNEFYRDQRWQVADATRPNATAGGGYRVFYLPLGVMDDESESYAFSLVENLNFAVEKFVIVD